MASNKDLIAKIKEINPDAKTDGLNNKQLTETYNLLKGGDAEPKEPKKSKGFKIAKGKAITSLRGILEAGDACTASDFSGGEETFARLKKNGAVV